LGFETPRKGNLTEHGEFAGNDEHLSIDRGFHFEFSGNPMWVQAITPHSTFDDRDQCTQCGAKFLPTAKSAPGVVQGFKTSSIIVANA